jgi:uncharacterized membrane protein YecN with MAPEG domain
MNLIALTCVAALGLLLFGLGLVVSSVRFRTSTLTGDPKDPVSLLSKCVRAHGNTAENVGFIAVLLLYLGSHDPAPWVVWTMVGITVCRYLLAAGLLLAPSMDKPNPLRFLGALGTYLCGLALSVALLLSLGSS